MAPFRGGSGEGRESYSLGTTIRDPDIESAERRREARAASEKAKQLLDERRQAQKALKAQVKFVRAQGNFGECYRPIGAGRGGLSVK